jgi:hypothetical protein
VGQAKKEEGMKNKVWVVIVCNLVIAVAVSAAPPREFKAEVQATGSVLALSVPVRGAVSAYLVVAGPNGFRVEKTFAGAESPTVNLSQVKDDQEMPLAFADGDYKWELRVDTPAQEVAAGEATEKFPEAGTRFRSKVETWVSSGQFKVQGGGIVPVEEPLHGRTPITAATQSTGAAQSSANAGSVTPQTYYADNLYLGGSGLCVGCANNDSQLSPPEIMIKSAGAPWLTLRDQSSNDTFWRWVAYGPLTFYSARNDGSSQTSPMTFEKNTPSNTLYIDSAGTIGIGSSAPISTNLYLAPLGARSWVGTDYAVTTRNYRVYQNTNHYFGIESQSPSYGIPFLITPTTPVSYTIVIDGGKVGFGTSTPYYDIDAPNAFMRVGGGVYVGANAGLYTLDFLGNTGADRNVFRSGISGYSNGFTVRYRNSPAAMLYSFINGYVGIGTTSPTHLLDVGTSGAYCNGGAWVTGSSREYKQDIEDLSAEAAEDAVAKLTPVTYEYKASPGEHHVGFIAEDVPDLVATADRKGMSAMDVVAVLTKVVQQQQATIQKLEKRIVELERNK